MTGSSGKLLLRHMLDNPSAAASTQLARHLGLLATLEDGLLERLCVQAIADMPEEADAGVEESLMSSTNSWVGS